MGRIYLKKNGAWAERNAELLYRKVNGQWVRGDWSELQLGKYRLEQLGFKEKIQYVSLGDSIAAGHTINAEWETNYGEGSQYGKNGNLSTAIVPQCYTDLIRNELVSIYGADRVNVTSFARSGDTVADLMDKLSHAAVRSAIEQADIVTLCIGANDVLRPALMNIEEYINTGDLSTIERLVEENLRTLDNDAAPTSYKSLFDRLREINPYAKYIFTSIYNPYKYLYLHTGHNGFFGPLLDTIPDMVFDVDEIIEDMFNIDDLGYWDVLNWEWKSIELKANISSLIKDGLLNTPAVQTLFSRVNGLSAWTEKYVEGTNDFDGLNRVLRRKVNAYQSTSPNFIVADTKPMFDLFPDRTDSANDVDYSDLVNVEFTRTFDTAKMDWGQLWKGSNAGTFWGDLAWKYLKFSNALPSTNVWDYVSFDLNGFAADLVQQIVEKVIQPDIDPHPEYQGHEVLKRSFSNVLGLVRYEANGGQCDPGEAVLAERTPKLTDATREGYGFEGWYTEKQQPAAEVALTDYKASFTLSDLVDGGSVRAKTTKTTTLYAMWSD